MSTIQFYGTGRRKTSIARVFLKSGNGSINLQVDNKLRSFEEYFPHKVQKVRIFKPLTITNMLNNFDLFIDCQGGGKEAQADAIKLGIARALLKFNQELRPILKKEGLLTRDSREKERRKYGLLKARKAPQYHKR